MAKCSKRYSEITTMSVSEALIIILLQPFLIAERACKIPSYLLPRECWKEDILLSKHASENALSLIIFSEAMKNIFLSILSTGFVVIDAVKNLEIGYRIYIFVFLKTVLKRDFAWGLGGKGEGVGGERILAK